MDLAGCDRRFPTLRSGASSSDSFNATPRSPSRCPYLFLIQFSLGLKLAAAVSSEELPRNAMWKSEN